MLNQGCPSLGWNARRQATHCVAPQRKASTTTLTARTWPQRILVAFMATEDQGAIEPTSQARLLPGGCWDSGAKGSEGSYAVYRPKAVTNRQARANPEPDIGTELHTGS